MGGFDALRTLIAEFPADFPASVFVVLHISSDHDSHLAEIFGRAAKLPVLPAKDLEKIKPGHVYIAMPDFHLQIEHNRIRLDHGPKQNRARPSVDALFFSAAKAFGPRVVGVVLTGALDDGTAGLMEIKRRGGFAIVQDPADAVNPSMPASALNAVPIDRCVRLADMGALLCTLPWLAARDRPDHKKADIPVPSEPQLSTHICPQCSGPMWCIETGKLLRFHCRIGHAFSGQSLLVEKTLALESALWSAVNGLKDKASIAGKLSQRAGKTHSYGASPDYFLKQAADAESYAEMITNVLLDASSPANLTNKKPTRSTSKKKPKGA